jgi:hypothetical protein
MVTIGRPGEMAAFVRRAWLAARVRRGQVPAAGRPGLAVARRAGVAAARGAGMVAAMCLINGVFEDRGQHGHAVPDAA